MSNLELSRKLHTLAEIIWYGMGWAEANVAENPMDGSYTTLSHQVACAICQWFDVEDGVDTGETEAFMFKKKLKSVKAVRKRLGRYIIHLQLKETQWVHIFVE